MIHHLKIIGNSNWDNSINIDVLRITHDNPGKMLNIVAGTLLELNKWQK